MTAFEVVDLASSLRIVYPAGTLWGLLLGSEAIGLAYGARRVLRRWTLGALEWLRTACSRWVGPHAALGTFLRSPVSTSQARVAEHPRCHLEAAVAAALAAAAVGTRPQVLLVLAGPVVWSFARSLLKGRRTWITFVVTGALTGAACWIPAILITGWRRDDLAFKRSRRCFSSLSWLGWPPG